MTCVRDRHSVPLRASTTPVLVGNQRSTDQPPLEAVSTHLRRAMSMVPTSITIAAGMDEGSSVGMVVGTFTSVSLDPLTARRTPQIVFPSPTGCRRLAGSWLLPDTSVWLEG
jgi:hypothetical protein